MEHREGHSLEGAGFSLNAGMAKDEDIPSSAFRCDQPCAFRPRCRRVGVFRLHCLRLLRTFRLHPEAHRCAEGRGTGAQHGGVLDRKLLCGRPAAHAWGKSIYDEPDEAKVKDLLAFFSRYAFAEVTDTRVTPGYAPQADGHDISVTYACTTVPVGTETPAAGAPLRAMYPHQYLGQPQVYIIDQLLKQVSSDSWNRGGTGRR